MADTQSAIDQGVSNMQVQMAILQAMQEQFPDQYNALMGQTAAYTGWQDKELKQTMDIANQTANNNRYSTDMNYKASKLNNDTTRRGQDITDATSRRGQDITQENNRGQLGLDYLKTASSMRGPADYFQASDFNRGAQQRQDVPLFLQSLMNTTGNQYGSFTGGGGAPAGYNVNTALAGLGMGGGAPMAAGGGAPGMNAQDAQALAGIKAADQAGAHTWAPGYLESRSPSELGLLQSGSEYSGGGQKSWDWNDLLNTYAKSRIANGSGTQA